MRLESIDPLLQHDAKQFHNRFRMCKMCVIVEVQNCEELSQSSDAHRSGDCVLSPMMPILVALRSIGVKVNIKKFKNFSTHDTVVCALPILRITCVCVCRGLFVLRI